MATWRPLILPREHGVWGLLAGAALVGLPQAADAAGAPLLASAVAGVVLRQAWCGDGAPWRRAVVVIAATALAAAGILATLAAAGDRAWAGWLVAAGILAAPLLVPIAGRPWWQSAAAALPAGALAGAVAMAGGAGPASAAVAGAALAAHLIAVVPLVRAQTRGGGRWSALAIELHAVALALACGAWAGGLVGSGVPLVFALGLARCAFLVDKRTPMSVSPARIGSRELAWLAVVAIGVHLGTPC